MGESAAHIVLASLNYGVDSYWKQLGSGSNNEDTRPEVSSKPKDALAMSTSFMSLGGFCTHNLYTLPAPSAF
jgi:hypothetical protein